MFLTDLVLTHNRAKAVYWKRGHSDIACKSWLPVGATVPVEAMRKPTLLGSAECAGWKR